MKKIVIFLVALFVIGPILSSCSSQRMCKSKKKYYKAQKCWNAKKQKYTRC